MASEHDPIVGRRIGRIRVSKQLAEGGMGKVYLGFDEGLERPVVLKAIRERYRLEPAARARFQREAKILSQLDHPQICKVFDLISDGGNDYLVLELVEGRNLHEALAAGLSWNDKMSVAEQLLEVLVAVHARGVIHRDLKPENIMINDKGEIKVLDFGLARSGENLASVAAQPSPPISQQATEEEDGCATPTVRIGTRSDEEAVLTRLGSVIGTVGYMSPEQARGEPATASSDMYSLGLVMQEMFTGKPPLTPNLDCNTMLQRAMWGDTEPVDGLPPDLTRLIERLTSLKPNARPSSIDAAELLHAVADRPRRRRRMLLVAAIWLVLSLFGAGMTVQYLRAEHQTGVAEAEARRAEQEREAVEQVADFMVGMFEVADSTARRGDEVSAREIVDQGARHIESELASQPIVQARLMHTLGRVYFNLGIYDASAHYLWQAAQVRSKELGEHHPDVAASLQALGITHRDAGWWGRCEQALTQALAIQLETTPPQDASVLRTKLALSTCLARLGRLDEALRLSDEAMAAVAASLGEVDPMTLNARVTRAAVLNRAGRLDEAETMYLEILERQRSLADVDHEEIAVTLNDLGILYRGRGDFAAAEARYREALTILDRELDPSHANRIQVLQNLASAVAEQGRFDETEGLLRRVVELRRAEYPDGHELVGTALVLGLGVLYFRTERYEDARRVLEEGLEVFSSSAGPDAEWTCYTRGALAAALAGLGRDLEAERLVEESAAGLEACLPFYRPFAERIERLIAQLRSVGRPDLADRYQALLAEPPG